MIWIWTVFSLHLVFLVWIGLVWFLRFGLMVFLVSGLRIGLVVYKGRIGFFKDLDSVLGFSRLGSVS